MNIIQKVFFFCSRGVYIKDGKAYAKEPFTMEGEEIIEHLKNEHPEAYDAVIESMRKKDER